MSAPLHIALLAFDGMQILDITGPAAVFAAANDACGRAFYRVHILSAHGGAVASNSAVSVASAALATLAPAAVDTLLIAGGASAGLRHMGTQAAVRDWVRDSAATARRYGSVCSGALALGAFGLLDGKRVATHWDDCAALARDNPRAQVDPNALYIQDGRLWTSAGVTTGIDMCLALVEQDLGSAISHTIAARFVLYARRPGYQSQFSPMLHAQARAGAQFSGLVDWMKDHLTAALDVPSLAARVAMSERSFHRKFTGAIGATPAYFVETLRLDHARDLLGAQVALKEIAARAGFSTPAQLSKAFERRFGVTPMLFREMQAA
ncbi:MULTISPECIES: GlxA family transcriptional regulator [unclassified Janthinobacterium]|uniref:GlxA family transcriptional regulator n=1 Tax=unclassified Janthinobacterium TaxID=2610881 RepID=UPI00034856CD|nr:MULTISPECIES: helix-turn-helix domain-containing protein [unclassified Janthinobacterium]MEC5163124.1 transcriptional regulator GlxA family with amidase domain [Janthinobacterium sp. CG_S6]